MKPQPGNSQRLTRSCVDQRTVSTCVLRAFIFVLAAEPSIIWTKGLSVFGLGATSDCLNVSPCPETRPASDGQRDSVYGQHSSAAKETFSVISYRYMYWFVESYWTVYSLFSLVLWGQSSAEEGDVFFNQSGFSNLPIETVWDHLLYFLYREIFSMLYNALGWNVMAAWHLRIVSGRFSAS